MGRKVKDPAADGNLKYKEAVGEIETILEAIDRDEVDIDDLSRKVERAVQLIRFCQEKLRATEMKVNQVLTGLKEEASEKAGKPVEEEDDEDDAATKDDLDSEGDRVAQKDDLPF